MNVVVVFIIQMFELILGALFWKGSRRGSYRNRTKGLSKKDRVLQLEERRKNRGYKKAWLYHRCKEAGLLEAYNEIFGSHSKSIDNPNPTVIRFSFGKYKGQPVEEVWKKDKGYINWMLDNMVLDNYEEEEFAINYLENQAQ